jgi:hypothetical protein
MAGYKIFILDANDRFVGVQNVICTDDAQAMAAARAVAAARGLLGGRSVVEVWGEGRMVGREHAANRSLKPVILENGQSPRIGTPQVGKRRRAAEIRVALKASQAILDAEMQAVSTWSRDASASDSTQPGSRYTGHGPEEEHPDAVTLRRGSQRA